MLKLVKYCTPDDIKVGTITTARSLLSICNLHIYCECLEEVKLAPYIITTRVKIVAIGRTAVSNYIDEDGKTYFYHFIPESYIDASDDEDDDPIYNLGFLDI